MVTIPFGYHGWWGWRIHVSGRRKGESPGGSRGHPGAHLIAGVSAYIDVAQRPVRYFPRMTINPLDIGDIAAIAASLIAIVAAVIAGLAKREARRSADAAEASAQADVTMVRLAQEEANRYRIPWRLEHDFKQRYKLVHDNDTETAYDIRVEGESVNRFDSKTTLGPQESMELMLVPGANMDRDVTVKWRSESDPEGYVRTWTSQP